MQKNERGFTLIELITVVILIGVMSVTLFSRFGGISTANLQAGRDDLIAALFFAQQTAMARSTNNIRVVLTTDKVSVTEDATPIVVHSKGYPLNFPKDIVVSAPTSFTYDKLGRTSGGTIVLSTPGGQTTSVILEPSGYAH